MGLTGGKATFHAGNSCSCYLGEGWNLEIKPVPGSHFDKDKHPKSHYLEADSFGLCQEKIEKESEDVKPELCKKLLARERQDFQEGGRKVREPTVTRCSRSTLIPHLALPIAAFFIMLMINWIIKFVSRKFRYLAKKRIKLMNVAENEEHTIGHV